MWGTYFVLKKRKSNKIFLSQSDLRKIKKPKKNAAKYVESLDCAQEEKNNQDNEIIWF